MFISKWANRSNHLVSLALYVLFVRFLLMSGSSAWWSVISSIGFPYMYSRKCSNPHTTASSSNLFIAYFFSVSDNYPLANPTGFRFPSFCFCQNVVPSLFLLASVVFVFSFCALYCAQHGVFVILSFLLVC